MNPDEAAQALQEIGQRQEQVIRLAMVPNWYWWSVGALMVILAVSVDSHRPLFIGIGITVFVLGILSATGRLVVGAFRHAQPRSDLLPPAGVLAILGFVAVTLAVSLPTAFALKAAGVPYAATWGVLCGAVLMVIGGPMLTRFLRRLMLRNRVGGRPRARGASLPDPQSRATEES